MARRKRFHSPGIIYHVMLRGNGGQNIFFSKNDRYRMCLLIQEGLERFGHRIHAFCFMSNHVHLALQIGTVDISSVMQHLACQYAKYVNRSQKRVGHLFQGRFKSIPVDGERYLNQLIRYIHLNPVRANLVKTPEEYIWSSQRAYIGLEVIPWLTQDILLNDINEVADIDFDSGGSEGVVGDAHFVERVLEARKAEKKREITLPDLVSIICTQYGLTENELLAQGKHPNPSRARSILAFLVRKMKTVSLEDLSLLLQRQASGLCQLANRIQADCLTSKSVHDEMIELQKKLFLPLHSG